MSALSPFGPDIWIAEGPTVPFFGFPYPTRMVLIRLLSGELFVWSPIALTETLKAETDALGIVRHLVSPNKIHHLFMAEWKRAYPAAKLYASPGLSKRRRDLVFDAELADLPQPVWSGEIDQVIMTGSFAMTEIVFFHRRSRTAIFADLIENFSPAWFKGWRRFLARLDGIVSPNPGAPREWRLSFINRNAARRGLMRILAWEPDQVVVAHGQVVRGKGGEFIRKAFRWLAR
jgi:hypothetical protein